jgi:hypothetical protein
LIQFKKTIGNQKEYCSFIQKHYKNKSMLDGVTATQHFLREIERKNKRSNYHYILSNLRMSICELG